MIFCGDAFSKAWGQGFALRGEFLSGCPERNQRGTRARLRMSASRSYSPPLDPILRGPPMREAGNHRKGAGGHGIGFRSITAAAEKPVTFGRCFSWLEARLLGWWGSSSAQGTAYPGACLGSRRGGTLSRPYSGQRTASKSAPSSAPFGGTFPLKGGKLDGKGPLIRLAFGQPPSPQGEGLGRSRIRAGSVGGETQAQKLNRTRGKFCALRARWPG